MPPTDRSGEDSQRTHRNRDTQSGKPGTCQERAFVPPTYRSLFNRSPKRGGSFCSCPSPQADCTVPMEAGLLLSGSVQSGQVVGEGGDRSCQVDCRPSQPRPSRRGKRVVIRRMTVSRISTMTTVQDSTLATLPLTYLPMSCRSFTSLSITNKMMGRRIPFRV